jgi:hypothetical protein
VRQTRGRGLRSSTTAICYGISSPSSQRNLPFSVTVCGILNLSPSQFRAPVNKNGLETIAPPAKIHLHRHFAALATELQRVNRARCTSSLHFPPYLAARKREPSLKNATPKRVGCTCCKSHPRRTTVSAMPRRMTGFDLKSWFPQGACCVGAEFAITGELAL